MESTGDLNVCLSGISYQFGELTENYDQASGYLETITTSNLPEHPTMWGWGQYHKTDDPYHLALQAARSSLNKAKVLATDIGLTIFACSYFPDKNNDLYYSTGKLLKKLELFNSKVEGATLMGCATLLNTIGRASALVHSGEYKNILVVGIDKLPDEYNRFWDYALFSDSAAACIVSLKDREPLEKDSALCIRSFHSGIDVDEIIDGVKFKSKQPLHCRVIKEHLEKEGMKISEIKKVFNNNVYLPVKRQKDTMVGFKKNQSYDVNISTHGHCFSNDSLINYDTFSRNYDLLKHERILFQADGNGCCATLMLESCA